ncbi:MAG TPA: NADH-quinone oxidoreductase subunit N [Candidatus Dormibacteraeota bacterium]|nr:NADH-quinone oxidoreductase subunit N [Candidatus Dormibacteraeota bacterium]
MTSFHATKDLIPEGVLLLGALVCGGLAAARRSIGHRAHMAISAATLVVAALTCLVYLKGLPGAGYDAYNGALVVDRFTLFAIPVLCGFALLTILAGDGLADRVRPHAGEYHALILTATLGGALLAAARDLVALYIALELLSVSLYVLVAITKTEAKGSEAAFKFLVLGAASSATLLYGFAMLYGLAGSTALPDIATALQHTTAPTALAIALALTGMAFKLGAVPFHQWVPDVYEGAPSPVAGLLASLSAAAGFTMVARFTVTALPQSTSTWTAVIAVVAAASMVYGNLAALGQRRLRRLLGYSSIGQAGFILMGLLGHGQDGVGASLFYLLTYGITVIGAFAAISAVEGGGVSDDLESYRGLSARSPLAAATLGVAMVSLIGVPPLVGFFAKLVVFQAAALTGWGWLVVLAVTATVVSAAYYLRVLRVIYIDAPAEGAEDLEPEPPILRGSLAAAAAATVFLGVLAQPLLHVATAGGGSLP